MPFVEFSVGHSNRVSGDRRNQFHSGEVRCKALSVSGQNRARQNLRVRANEKIWQRSSELTFVFPVLLECFGRKIGGLHRNVFYFKSPMLDCCTHVLLGGK